MSAVTDTKQDKRLDQMRAAVRAVLAILGGKVVGWRYV